MIIFMIIVKKYNFYMYNFIFYKYNIAIYITFINKSENVMQTCDKKHESEYNKIIELKKTVFRIIRNFFE